MQAIAQSVYQYHAASKRDCSALLSLHQQAVQWQGCVPPSPHASTTPARQATSPPYHQPHACFVLCAMCFVLCALCLVSCASVPPLRLLSFPAPQQGRLGGHDPTSALSPNMAAYNTARSVPAFPSSTRQTVHALKLVPWNSCPGAGPGTGPGTTAGHCPNGRSLSPSRLMRNGRMAGVCSARPPWTIQRVNAWR
jgi:hypothetical protein